MCTVFARSDAAATNLFHHAILCGFYLRAATNREQHLLNSVLSIKSTDSELEESDPFTDVEENEDELEENELVLEDC